MGTSSLVFHYRRRLIRFLLYTNFIPDLILKMKLLIPIFAAVVLAEELQETIEVVEAVPAKVESYVQNMRPIVNTWNNAAYRYPAYYNGTMDTEPRTFITLTTLTDQLTTSLQKLKIKLLKR